MERGQRALVTGASAGIGKAYAERLGALGLDLVLTARRRDRLETLAGSLAQTHGVKVDVIAEDLADPGAPERIAAQLRTRPVDVLINNAGFGLPGRFIAVPWPQHAAYIQLMVTAVTHLTHLCLPPMLERRRGYIAQIASLAALLPGSPEATLYAATKAFLLRFSESLAAELEGSGVRVTAVCPGLTYSEFHDVTGTREQMNQVPPLAWQTAAAVVEESLEALRRGDPVYVTGRLNRWVARAVRVLPQQTARNLMRRRPSAARPGPTKTSG